MTSCKQLTKVSKRRSLSCRLSSAFSAFNCSISCILTFTS
nr:MAG TPA_asm: hypothetical protein [Caudoviricetes sp.]